MRTTARSLVFWLLALTTTVVANPFWFRDESSSSSASSTAAPSSKASEASASPSGTTPPAAAATTANGTAAASDGTTNGTAAATSSSSAAATSSAFLPDTPEKLRCHIDKEAQNKPEEDISPFCSPTEGQYVHVGKTYNVTWDPTLFTYNSTNVVEIKHANGTTNSSNLAYSAPLPNEKGYWVIEMSDDFLQNGHNNTNLTLFIVSSSPHAVRSGPVFTLITNSTSNHTSHGNSSKDLGEKAGIPVGLGIFLIAAAGLLFWFLRRRRNRSAG
ncbi:MAG: hypothetical protein Q9225_003352, partial [Loekoesia sp. 1 TL-2023]